MRADRLARWSDGSDSADRRVRRRRLLDGGWEPAARRLRARRSPERERPKVCFVPTASGDADHYVVRFYRTFSARCERQPRLAVPPRPGAGAVEGDLEAHLLAQDLIYVGGGSVVRLLGAWRAHGLDASCAAHGGAASCCAACQRRLAVLVPGGRDRVPRRADEVVRGLGLLPHSNCVHYDGEPERREEYRRFVGDGVHARLRRRRRRRAALRRARAAARRQLPPGRAAFRVEPREGEVVEEPLPVSYLGRARPSWRPREPRRPRSWRMGGGGFTMGRTTRRSTTSCCPGRRPRAARSSSCRPPRGDPTAQIAAFYARSRPAVGRACSRCSACTAPRARCASIVLEQDVIYVGGGSMRNLLAIWRAHGLDELLREAWRRGIVLAGPERRRDVLVQGGITMSGGPPEVDRRPRARCPARCTVHADGEPERLPVCLDAVRAARCPAAGRSTTASACCSQRRRADARRLVAAGRGRAARRRGRRRARAPRSSPSCSATARSTVPDDVREFRAASAASRRSARRTWR